MRARKRFAQHWLKSEQVLGEIVTAAELKKSDRLLEIGPGQGVLTDRLLPWVEALVAVEIDRDLVRRLVHRFGKTENFLLLEGDILTLDLKGMLADFPRFQNPNKVVANIPYNITGPILQFLLGTIEQPRAMPYESIVLLVQQEICDRLCAEPHQKNFGALSVRVQYLAQCEQICQVPPKAFSPPPKVNSAVVRLRPFKREHQAQSPQQLATLVKVGFASKRKMLRNNLKGLFPEERINQCFAELNLNPQSRAENLGVDDWIALSNKIGD
ncbi:16S rRNA (adenine(1518)-N(6)/adenine(1519)-N(6))-dimethyltransferase RsmA [Spirulina subsalsa FACHB-351]|uniref:Ribosomal RNA small subunit methyltransferase A n=1 Tax=Spirulina subsalsa FACHB-351 TaxID=234711 RepID=A0ABT3LA43_9CYAN|nr:16S rRNA (adenine(1518)-N(6)/adenine(1519)-N(6))-dimethyltransferase RsmA [Spirulina subsalsa]MCW6038376.1 16S rRNA (adenine(1518)-N(6)/adenine(1519)-N(6))-dimethyltransferase RsmA [Spirulina subsalsa FACHB-351]